MDSTVGHAVRPSVREDRGPFLFARGYACDDRASLYPEMRRHPERGTSSPARGTDVLIHFLTEDTTSEANVVKATGTIGVLVGGALAGRVRLR
jgi:hypothetical protein